MYRHYFAEGKTLPEAYHRALWLLHKHGNIYPCPDYNTTIKECGMTFFVENAMAEPYISKLSIGSHSDMAQYELEILDGILDFKIGVDTSWEYTYHNRYINQLPFIYEELERNEDSRRAVMNIRDFEVDSKTDHPACLQSIQFLVRDGVLNMQIVMRSNDAVQATILNAYGFIALQRKVAEKMGLPVGSYTHTAHSFHAYERSFAMLDSYAHKITNVPISLLTYRYNEYDKDLGCSYKELKEEAIPEVMAKVQKVKDNQ